MTDGPDVALVGPSRPFGGGIADHTVELASRLRRAGLLSEHAGWGRQFPPWIARRSIAPVGHCTSALEGVTRDLHWDRPATWVRVGARLRSHATRLVLVVSSPLQMPAVRTISGVFRGYANSREGLVTLIVHNVIPHESFQGDRSLMRWTLAAGDRTVVHSQEQAELARSLGAREVRMARLPLHPPAGLESSPHAAGDRQLGVLGFVGYVRPYKGLDLLIEALGRTRTRPRLVVRGEFWEPVEGFRRLAADHGVEGLVDLRPGYVDPGELGPALAGIDGLVLPYRTASASQQPRLAFLRGVPVIATRVGELAEQIRHDIDGLIVREASVEALAEAIDTFYESNRWLRLRASVSPPEVDAEWTRYLETLN